MDPVRQQYEDFPYPPISPLALPARQQGAQLRYEYGESLRGNSHASHAGRRILVAGAGTLEALVVAQQHPYASEIVAVDLSQRSLSMLQRRLLFARLRDICSLRVTQGRRLPAVRCIQADLRSWQQGKFDFILANNVIHHVSDPAALLRHLAAMLTDTGLMRVVTYPYASRFWIRQTGLYLRLCGLGPATHRLVGRAREVIERLPLAHPLRSCFNAHSERHSRAGLVDAFLHACENPLSALQWQQAAQQAGLQLLAETQSRYSNSDYLLQLLPESASLTRWQRLEIMDRFMEVSTNPVFWFAPAQTSVDPGNAIFTTATTPAPHSQQGLLTAAVAPAAFMQQPTQRFSLPSLCYWQLAEHLRSVQPLLQQIGVGVAQLGRLFHQEFGVHMSAPPHSQPLPGLAMSEYDCEQLLSQPRPWQPEHWQQLQAMTGNEYVLYQGGRRCDGDTLSQQVQLLQLVQGAQQAVIEDLALQPRH